MLFKFMKKPVYLLGLMLLFGQGFAQNVLVQIRDLVPEEI